MREAKKIKKIRVIRKKGFLAKKFKKSKKYYVLESIRKFVMICSLCIFSFCSYEITNKMLDYKSGTDTYSSFEDEILIPNIVDSGESETDAEGNIITNSNEQIVWSLDFDKLKQANAAAVGWIKQDNIISYPIVQGTDNDYYLKHSITQEENGNGAIFVDYRIPDGLEAKNCIIYGHDMLNDSMFGSLVKYSSKSYYDEHPTMDIYVGKTCYKYYIFATYETEETADTYTYEFASDEEFQKYIDDCMARKMYATNVSTVTTVNKLVTLSTCTRGDQSKRFIVQMIRGEEVKN